MTLNKCSFTNGCDTVFLSAICLCGIRSFNTSASLGKFLRAELGGMQPIRCCSFTMNKYNNGQYISLSRQAQHTIVTDIFQHRSIEACGVLLGFVDELENWRVEDAYPLPNIFNSPIYFEFNPEDLLQVELMYPEKIIGVYHSHPTGFARASDTDRQNMQRVNVEEQIPWAWLIICGPFDQTTTPQQLSSKKSIAYHHFDKDGLQQVTLRLSESSNTTIDET